MERIEEGLDKDLDGDLSTEHSVEKFDGEKFKRVTGSFDHRRMLVWFLDRCIIYDTVHTLKLYNLYV